MSLAATRAEASCGQQLISFIMSKRQMMSASVAPSSTGFPGSRITFGPSGPSIVFSLIGQA